MIDAKGICEIEVGDEDKPRGICVCVCVGTKIQINNYIVDKSIYNNLMSQV